MVPTSTREEFEASLPFGLDDFQLRALDAIDAGASVMVAAPTGSGKTVIAEYAVHRALVEGGRVFYTAPIKALSNQKYHDLVERLGTERVGLLTGDNSVNDAAPVVVMTTEVLRNMIYARSASLKGLRYVVLDEVHYLQDPFRGPVWEEVIIHTPPEVDLVCLSATVSNAEEIADWVTTVRGRTTPIIHEIRPIELKHLYLVGDRTTGEVTMLPTFVRDRPNPQAAKLDSTEAERATRGSRRPIITPKRVDIIETLYQNDMLPAITFIFSRSGCDEAVSSCLAGGLRLTSPHERRAIREIISEHTKGLERLDLRALEFDRFSEALERGFAAHHAGMVPAFKEAVEACFVEGLVKSVFATETLALGINMPARTVVIEKLSKFGGERHKFLTPGEFTQLTGRAGRRGIDPLGFAVTLWSPFVAFEEIATLASHRSFELRSAFRPTNNMAVNLVRRYGPEEAHHLLGLSLAQFQIDRELVSNNRRAEAIRREIAEAESLVACDRGDVRAYLSVKDKRSLRPGAPDAQIDAALERLCPGDVLAPLDAEGHVVDVNRNARSGDGWVVIVGTAKRKDRPVALRGVGPSGKLISLTTRDFRSEPQVVSTLRLPSPFNPNSRSFIQATAQGLQRVMEKHGVSKSGERASKRGKFELLATGAPVANGSGTSSGKAAHPVSTCPDLSSHLRALRRIDILTPEVDRLQRVSKRRSHSLGDEFDRVLQFLEHLGYLEGWSVTSDGDVLAGLFHESDVLIAECVLEGVFDGLTGPQLAALASVFVFEQRGRGSTMRVATSGRKRILGGRGDRDRTERQSRTDLPTSFPKVLAPRWWTIVDIAAELAVDLAEHQLPALREVDPGFVSLTFRWASGRTLSEVLRESENFEAPTGGDFVRTTKSLVDLLRQIGDVAPLPETRSAAREASDLLFRGVVSASSVAASSAVTSAVNSAVGSAVISAVDSAVDSAVNQATSPPNEQLVP
jgi:ATP-dependent RNA helicase HelY